MLRMAVDAWGRASGGCSHCVRVHGGSDFPVRWGVQEATALKGYPAHVEVRHTRAPVPHPPSGDRMLVGAVAPVFRAGHRICAARA
jgi:hypothetical protein